MGVVLEVVWEKSGNNLLKIFELSRNSKDLLGDASMNRNVQSMHICTMNPQTHSPDTFAGGIIPFHTQNENHVNVK